MENDIDGFRKLTSVSHVSEADPSASLDKVTVLRKAWERELRQTQALTRN